MRYYFAPMEGITDSIYRAVHHKYFPGLDGYYMPFLSPTMHRTLSHKEQRELPRADSVPFRAVPQILTKNADDFLWAADLCAERGYDEVNLNIGCPSGTVVAKGKGAAMLAAPQQLDAFLEKVVRESPLPVSVKTRLGMENADEFPALMEIFDRYPLHTLIIHPRVRKQFYGGSVDMDAFRFAAKKGKNPLCYNGDLRSRADIEQLASDFPSVDAMMLGRGLVADPGMLSNGGTTIAALEGFTEELLARYIDAFGGARNALCRMKEIWSLLLQHFVDSEKLGKALRKATDLGEFRALCAQVLHTLPHDRLS